MKFNTVRHLTLFLASLLAIALLASWVLIAKKREHTNETLETATQKQLQLLHDGLYTKLNQLERVLVEGSHLALKDPSSTYMEQHLQMLKAMHPDFASLDFTPLPPPPESQQTNTQSKLQIQVSFQAKGQAQLVLKHPVETLDGHTIGLLVGNISTQTINKTLERLSVNNQTVSAIAFSDGRLIAIEPEPASQTSDLQALNAWSHTLDLATYPKHPVKLSAGPMINHYTVGTPLLPSASESTPWPLLLVTWVDASNVESKFLQDGWVWLACFGLLAIFTLRLAHQLREQLKTQQDFQEATFAKQQHQQDAAQALQQAEERFRSAFESSAIGMAILSPEGLFTQVNSALCQWIGYQPSELLRMDHISISHPEDAMLHWPSASHIGNDIQDDYQVEQRYIHQEGRVLWGLLAVSAVRDVNHQILHIILQVQDITARKQQEASLIEREHFLRTLSECLPSLVSYWSADLYCHFANKNHEKWTGIPSDKMRGLHLRHVMGESDFLEFEPYIHGVLLGKQQRFERSVAHTSGQQDDLLVHLIPDVLYGHVEGFFSIATSITDFKTQQRELERMNKVLVERTDQAETANKAKGAFLANMSHEIRTPMNAIMGLLQLIEQTDLNPIQRNYISKIGGAADVLLNVLNDILDLSRIEANKLELRSSRFNLHELLQQTLDLFSYRAEEKGIQISCTKHPDCPNSLMGDRLRIAQVLNNLLSNALKFTEKGEIEVQVAPNTNQRTLVFCVKDSGIGISKTQLDLLFQPFSQIDNSPSRRYGGAGLGLSICKQITELMHGKIWVQSELGQGTSFYVEIPNRDPDYTLIETPQKPQNPAHKASATHPQPLALEGTKILVVDDHKLNQMVASEMLKNWGAEVHMASNGREAVVACTQTHFDWVLMDLQMPEMDGFEATRLIQKKLGEHAPNIIALTASASPHDVAQLHKAGMCGHIVKPFKKEQLLEVMGVLRESDQTNSVQLLPVK